MGGEIKCPVDSQLQDSYPQGQMVVGGDRIEMCKPHFWISWDKATLNSRDCIKSTLSRSTYCENEMEIFLSIVPIVIASNVKTGPSLAVLPMTKVIWLHTDTYIFF